MLQQTQVVTVVEYFKRFVATFPSVETLAAAEEQDVFRLWQGLGYYRRARSLHQAARLITREHGGEFPQEMTEVRRLPGIGRYTAGAILSIAFDQPHPILEANTVRLHSRLLAYSGPTHMPQAQQLLWQMAEAVLPRRGAGALNQALMELGATVCLPRQPRCDACPVASFCRTFERGLQAKIPVAKPRLRVEQVREAAVLVRRGGRVLVLQHGENERWAGLWGFPRFPVASQSEEELHAELAAGVYTLTGIKIAHQRRLGAIQHGVTRFRITLECHAARPLSSDRSNGRARRVRWVTPAELESLPLSVPARRLSRML
jgi:A/G-specific adenine glycosylase